MNELQNNESLRIIIIALSTVSTVAIALVGYFMSKRDDAITQATDSLTKANENLGDTVAQLKTIVNGLQLQYQIRQPIIDQQLELHRRQMEESVSRFENIDKRLNTIETEHKMFRCEYNPQKRQKQKPNETN
jgi:flagellar basal body-associated protein FliL